MFHTSSWAGDVVRRSVVEAITGTQCQWCPRAASGFKLLQDKYGDKVIPISVHAYNMTAKVTDPMYCLGTQYNMGGTSSLYYDHLFSGIAPLCIIDRKSGEVDPYGPPIVDGPTILENFQKYNSQPAEVDVKVEGFWNEDHTQVKATSNITYLSDGGKYTVAYVLTADGLTGTSNAWRQYNGYSGEFKGKLYEYEELPDDMKWLYNSPVYLTDYVYDNVMIGSSWDVDGTNTAAPLMDGDATSVNGESVSSMFMLDMPSSEELLNAIKYDKVSVIALVFNANGEIANAAKVAVEEPVDESGDYLTLPFKESFANGHAQNEWTTTRSGITRWMPLADNKYIQDNDGGMLTFTPPSNECIGDESRYISAPISLRGSENPILSLYSFFAYLTDDEFTILVSREGGDFEVVKTIDLQSETSMSSWVRTEIPLKDYIHDKYIQIALNIKTAGGLQTIIYVDNILIEDVQTYNLTPSLVFAPKRMRVGNSYNFVAKVENRGLEDVVGYTVALMAGNEMLDEESGLVLSPGYSKTYTFSVVPTNDFSENAEMAIVVTYSDDSDTKTSQVGCTVPVRPSRLPQPTDLTFTDDDKLSWKAPEKPTDAPATVTDGFEDYEAFTISDFGDWTLIDGDQAVTYGIGSNDDEYDFTNMGEPMSYIVFNPALAGLDVTSETAIWKAYNGSQVLVSFGAQYATNDNWLISPELDGASQTLSFFARSATSNYGLEQFEVLSSETDAQLSSFSPVQNKDFTGKAPAEWMEYTFKLPAGSRYFAIHCTTHDGYGLLIDDITYTPDSIAPIKAALQGYNIYVDGEQVNEDVITSTTCDIAEFVPEEDGDHEYKVTAVYDKGESPYSNAIRVNTTGVGRILSGDAVPSGDCYDLAGRRVASPRKGLYIIGGKKVLMVR